MAILTTKQQLNIQEEIKKSIRALHILKGEAADEEMLATQCKEKFAVSKSFVRSYIHDLEQLGMVNREEDSETKKVLVWWKIKEDGDIPE